METTIGEQLRTTREERGIALRDISEQTHISVRYLEAIETNDYKKLPGGIFNRSFVKAYARCVGYDEKRAIEAYAVTIQEQGQSVDDDPPYHSKVYTDEPSKHSSLWKVLMVIGLLALLALATYAGLHFYRRYEASLGTSSNNKPRLDLEAKNYAEAGV